MKNSNNVFCVQSKYRSNIIILDSAMPFVITKIDQIFKIEPNTKKLLLQIGKPSKIADQFSQWPHLDGRCSAAREISEAELTVTSVLTTAKNSVIAGEIRDSAYSVLEELGIA